MTMLFAIGAGILLAASAGLRAFMPLLGLGLAARLLDWPVATSMQWIATDAALIGLTVAALAEIVADKVPAVDHVLDMIHTVVGPLAGALVAEAAFEIFNVTEMDICPWALREGLILRRFDTLMFEADEPMPSVGVGHVHLGSR